MAAIARISAKEAEATQIEREAALADEQEFTQSFGPDTGTAVQEDESADDDGYSDEEGADISDE